MLAASDVTFAEIKARLSFIPPFFEPASAQPKVLANLWQQTENAYLDNPLPALFKEKLAALLGRYCEVPYCLVCHTCTLRPLGMGGPAIVELLTLQLPSDEAVADAIDALSSLSDVVAFPLSDSAVEKDIFTVCSALYTGGTLATDARDCLRRRFSTDDYQNLIMFTSYNRMCHDWIAAHPEVSYELDERYVQNVAAITDEAPAIAEFFASRGSAPARAAHDVEVASQRASEANRSAEISDQRFLDVVRNLNASIAAATQHASENESFARELRRTADFAQELLAIVSHDLRNPLSTVLMGAEILAQAFPDNEKVMKPLTRVLSAARRAERMIHDLLDFSQARAGGGIPINLQAVDVHDLVRHVVEELQVAHPTRAIRLTHEGSGAGDFDADRLTQAVSNLLSNAITHGHMAMPIELRTLANAQSVTIEVQNANKGEPISEDLLPLLFDPFKRGVARAISRTRSIGLGLYIVDQIVKGHRGRVDVISLKASGTTSFSINLPRTESSPAVAPRPSVAPDQIAH